MSKNETGTLSDLLGALDKVRAEIAETEEEIDLVEHAFLPREEAEANIREWVQSQASRAVPNVFAFMSPSARPVGRNNPLRATGRTENPYNADVGITDIDLAPMLCAIAPKAVTAWLEAQLPEDTEAGPPARERPGILTKLRQRLRELEHSEEALCDRLYSDHGHEPARRPEARVEVILGLEDAA